ncbi:DUF4184 family protein [Paenibacillus sp. 1011MAR3C5]|uniref:DUF4184 family protein n=1 Tax=Paenibacillus sp. 1011MAR3C5 TaxID=1675787 RepID=UPI000E6BD328|nr:DUF4184 family protein [Paenibacillus sp. 1011MAR3C5]RJE88767.1 DUF4184 family protein [Paenibacillus sp. 1011MAR3C5]
MPFTFAHPLYAAPLKLAKPGWFSLTGLILGSMSPDFEYFIALEPYQTFGHSGLGLLMQGIPLSLLFAFLFHSFIKFPLVDHLPCFFGLSGKARELIERYPWRMMRWSDWLVFLVSVVVGFGTHVFLDAFTHLHGYFVVRWPFLNETLFGYPVYKLLQHGLSLTGLTVVGIMALIWLRRPAPEAKETRPGVSAQAKWLYWAIVVFIIAATTVCKLFFSTSGNYIGMLVVSPVSGFWLGLTVASIGVRVGRR